MLFTKRKEKLIRDIAAMVFVAIDKAVARLARPRREALDREEVERIAALVVGAIQADMIEWVAAHENETEVLEAMKVAAPYDVNFGDADAGGLGRLLIERTGPGDDQFRLVARLPPGKGPTPHNFGAGSRDACIDVWETACAWMAERFPENKA